MVFKCERENYTDYELINYAVNFITIVNGCKMYVKVFLTKCFMKFRKLENLKSLNL